MKKSLLGMLLLVGSAIDASQPVGANGKMSGPASPYTEGYTGGELNPTTVPSAYLPSGYKNKVVPNYVDAYNPNVDNRQTMSQLPSWKKQSTMTKLPRWKEHINRIPRWHHSRHARLIEKETQANAHFGQALENLTQSIEKLVKASVDVKVYEIMHRRKEQHNQNGWGDQQQPGTTPSTGLIVDPSWKNPNITSLGGNGTQKATPQSTVDDIFKDPNGILTKKKSTDTTSSTN